MLMLATVVLAVALASLVAAQPGPYPVWSIPTDVRMSTPAVGYGMVYASPFLFSEEGTLPFAAAGWNSTTGASVFTIPYSAAGNRVADWKGIPPAVTRYTTKAGVGKIVMLYAFHIDGSVRAVDGLTGEALWSVDVYPSQCGNLYCSIAGLSAPVEGSFIVEQPSFLLRLDAATGRVVWNTSVGGNDLNPGSWRSHVAADDETAFIVSARDYVHRVDFYTGGFLFSAQITLPNCSNNEFDSCVVMQYTPPKVVGDYIIVGGAAHFGLDEHGAILCLWKRTRGLRWWSIPSHFAWDVAASASIAVSDPGVYDEMSSPRNGTFAVFNLTTGKELWHLDDAGYFFGSVAVDAATSNVVTAAAKVLGSTVLTLYDGVTGAVKGTMGIALSDNREFAVQGSMVYASLSDSYGTGHGIVAIYIGN